MKLNPNCVRDILLTVEANDLDTRMTLESLHKKLSHYTIEEIYYACLKLNEANYLEATLVTLCGHHTPAIKCIYDLTYNGHEFLENIKSDSTWNKTKDIAKSVGSFSLSTLKEIAINVISESIKLHF
ncbi:Hypothetical protein SAMN02745248_02448 [Hathewaya proteolytica DSM 3090]|uniref:DUF2513 domain-containing protein n=1 Tax=Hathewaya proteolytica DSM 3090 TaxID=1121331 RepID=A0A1M6S3T7_9CLOT|nr:DUF2513 domain-containing protein [Hathewaya proteolytica]SHK39413.1 Hypothetical protein SAMN02745248_02448 [Hathewaya proteolytica DSM 3090]